jgi:hypothetical protein
LIIAIDCTELIKGKGEKAKITPDIAIFEPNLSNITERGI